MPTRVAIGVDLGGTKLLAGAVGQGGVVGPPVRRLVAQLDQPGLLGACASAVAEVHSQLDPQVEVVGVGFGIPCLIDQTTGTAVMAVNLPLRDLRFRDAMTERLALPVEVDNDANCALLAELHAGAARGLREVALLTLGTGIGGGLAFGGEVYRGALGAGAELGHMTIDLDGPPCQGACPNRGCLESLASGTALLREARLAGEAAPTSGLGQAVRDDAALSGARVTELARRGDAPAVATLALIGRRLGVGIASLVNLLNPEAVIVGGGVIGAGELLLAPAREELLRRALSPSKESVRVLAAALGPDAGMIGAALLAGATLEPDAMLGP